MHCGQIPLLHDDDDDDDDVLVSVRDISEVKNGIGILYTPMISYCNCKLNLFAYIG